MKQSLVSKIEEYFNNHPDRFYNGGELERLAFENGYKASNCSRRLREMAESGFLAREIRRTSPSKVASVWYRKNMLELKDEKADEKAPLIEKIAKQSGFTTYSDNYQEIPTLFTV